jgi:hypothetical protein
VTSRAWWLTAVIPALGRLRQENGEFKASLGYIERTPSQKEGRKEGKKEGRKKER